jgi:O-antigen ligase
MPLRLVVAAALAVTLLVVIPNRLQWASNSPYVDSLTTMVSLESSSGRDKLWTVAFHVLGVHPLLGVGTGNYSVLWRSFISETNVDPAVFAFIRPDLPLFNDYLQVGVESGVFAAALFAFALLVLPARAFLRLVARRDPATPVVEALPCLMSLGVAVDALSTTLSAAPRRSCSPLWGTGSRAVRSVGPCASLPRARGAPSSRSRSPPESSSAASRC